MSVSTQSKTEQKKLTKKVIDDAPITGRRYELWDPELPGFGLRVEASGTKTFIVRYRANGGGRKAPRRFMKLERYGVLTPTEARQRAKKILAAVTDGRDPAADLSAKRKEMTIAELVDHYAREGCFVQRGKRQG